ncbi:MAG: aminotransferase class I/II-fold pyridoxal phosphate-dependent enzyme [Spirochaetaceae bacterium]|nr:aminotransferase class I/II-fold pyridoxal phosphate-dependent enzyme [Spirochaetaceae bacterium]
MKYDFTTIMERKGKDAIAVDLIGKFPGFAPSKPKEGFDVLPMWVADMNFATAPSIQEAMIERIKHPAFGYFKLRDEYYDSIINWQKKQFGITSLTKENIGYQNGVLGGVISALNVLCSRGDNVLLHSPTYIGFTHALGDNGYNIVHTPLIKDEQGIWRMDFDDMERKIIKNKIHAAIFCSPHNPTGRVWERTELEKVMELYKKHNVYVISDEIWSDLILEGHKHIPLSSINEDAKMRTISMYAPSKTFNLAGLIGSYHVIFNEYLRDRVNKESSISHYNDCNVLSMYALIGAYNSVGSEWLKELLEVLNDNANYAYDFINSNFEGVSLSKPEGTYMIYIDVSGWCKVHNITLAELLKKGSDVGVGWQDGSRFKVPYTIRVNLALPKSEVIKAFHRLDKYVFNSK